MTLFTRLLGLALLATLALCLAVILTTGHPQHALDNLSDLYRRVTH